MAPTIDEIAELINTMRVENENNVEYFEKALTAITTKLEIMAGDSEATDLIKVYLAELKNLVDEKHGVVTKNINSIASQLDEVLALQNDGAKTSELRDLFQVLSLSFDSFLSNFSSQKEVLEKFDAKLEGLEEKTLDKSEFSSLINNFSGDISKMNDDIDKSFAGLDGRFAEISELIAKLNVSDYANQINNNIQVLSDNVNALPSKISFANLEEKLEHTQDILDSLKDVVLDISTKNSMTFAENFTKLETTFESIITDSDFTNFKKDLADFVQKIIDNSSVLNDKLSYNAERIENILSALNSLDYKKDFSEISEKLEEKISELKKSYEKTSTQNFENITNEIQDLKASLSMSFESCQNDDIQNFEKISSALDVLSEDIQVLQNVSGQKHEEILEKLLGSVQDTINEISERFCGEMHGSFEDVKLSFANTISEINDLRSGLLSENSTTSALMSAGFDKVKQTLEDLLDGFKLANDELQHSINQNTETILANIDELNGKADEHSAQIADLKEKSSFDMKDLSENIADLKNYTSELADSLKNYISELNSVAENNKSEASAKVVEKLLDLETMISHSVDDYGQNSELLHSKISEFSKNIENSSSETIEKINSSIEEISDVKSELALINDLLKSTKHSVDDKSVHTITAIEENVEKIISQINDILASSANDIQESVNEKITNLETKFENLQEEIAELKLSVSQDMLVDIGEKISTMSQEIGLVNTDIAEAFQHKTEDIINAVELVKEAVDDYTGNDFNKLIEDLKSQLETSFMNFSVDVNGELASGAESINKLEQSYKEIFNKISVIEECVADRIQEDIELLNVTIDSNVKDLKCNADEKLDSYISDLKTHFDEILNSTNSRVLDVLSDVKEELITKIDGLSENSEAISSDISNLGEDIKNYVKTISDENLEKYNPETNKELINSLHQKFDMFVFSDKTENIMNSLDGISQRIESFPTEKEVKTEIDNIKEDINSGTNNSLNEIKEQFTTKIEEINNKIDVVVSDNSAEDIQDRLDDISETENKVSEMLAALHEKVDVIAMDDFDYDFEAEIDDIKELIFEQRKYFEVASDEKANAIDKYLKDVLMKLDNVDMEKSADDIKESIMNALVSLVDQISFVEETEEIKDFVEEKTDIINKNLIQVQNQLRQIVSSSDEFDYSYTLQDVESDIAKLRMAITNLSGDDFESLSDGIKKIVNSVEGIESSLTQDQIVDLKSDIEKLNEDILSISSRTNKLLLTSDESYKTLNDGLNNFSSLVNKLEDRINYLDNSEVTERLERKIDNIQNMSTESANADKIFHQVMMYLGEWIDSTTENISSISEKVTDINEKTLEIQQVKENIEKLKESMPESSDILNELENKFEQQEERIDRLEMKLEKILSTLEEKDDMVLNRKVDKIEKMLSRLGTNIEKLTSYVDE